MKQKILLTVILIFFCIEHYSQNDCSDNLNRARQNFDDGFIEDIPSLLVPCLEVGFTREQKISAYKLLILTYLFDDNQGEAENAILEFFKDFPNYEVRTDDPPEFLYLLESYEAIPVYSFYGGIGLNQSIIQTRDVFSLSPTPEKKTFRIGNTGYNFMVGASYNLDKYKENLSANARLELLHYRFEINEVIPTTSSTNYLEKQTRINIPLFASYNLADIITELIVTPEVYLGFNLEFTTSTSAVLDRNDYSEIPIPDLEKSIESNRRTFEPSLLVGLNYSYPVTKGNVFFDIHSKIGFSRQRKNQRSNTDISWSKYYYEDNGFLLHNLFFNIGYRYTFYKPTKIR